MEDLDMEVERLKCIICCSSNRKDFSERNSAENRRRRSKFKTFGNEHHDHDPKTLFIGFCKELELVSSDGSLSLDSGLSVCSNCVDNIQTVLDTKERMEVVEYRVEKLQRSILQEIKELQVYLDLLNLQLRKIEVSVKDSNGDSLQLSGSARRSSSRGCSSRSPEDVIFIRNRLCTVTKDMQLFTDALRKRFGINSNPISKKNIPVSTQTTLSRLEDSIRPANRNSHDPVTIVSAYSERSSPNDRNMMSTVSTPSPASGVEFDNENVDDEIDSLDFFETKVDITHQQELATPSNVQSQSSPPAGIISTLDRCTRSGRKITPARNVSKTYVQNEIEDDSYDAGEAEDSSYLLDNNDNSDQVDSESENESPSPSKKQSRTRKSKPCPGTYTQKWSYYLPENFDFSEMSTFKKYAIRSLMYRNPDKPEEDEKSTNENDKATTDPSGSGTPEEIVKRVRAEIYAAEMEYNAESCTFHLRNVEVKINEEDKSAECSLCPYKSKVRWPPENRHDGHMRTSVKHHILTNHLNIIQCKPCNRTFRCYKTYKRHLQRHQNIPVPSTAKKRDPSVLCHDCGLAFRSALDLEKHSAKHKSEEEKRQLVETGEFTENELRDENDTVLCIDCGMSVPQVSLWKHKRFSCKDFDVSRVKCEHCDMTFKNRGTMKRHMQRIHFQAGLRPFECEVCHKTFKTKRDLGSHIKIHSSVKPFVCRKGCGKAYAIGRRRTVHEATCKFRKHYRLPNQNINEDNLILA